jgi:hypothetical protein
MECGGQLPRLKVPATCPYPETDQYSPCPPIPKDKDSVHAQGTCIRFVTWHDMMTWYVFTAARFPPCGSGRYACRKIGTRQHTRRNDTQNNTKTQNAEFLWWGVVSTSPKPPSWRTTSFLLSAIAYSIYSQLPSMLDDVSSTATWGRAV